MRRLLCWLGLHRWKAQTWADGETVEHCRHCPRARLRRLDQKGREWVEYFDYEPDPEAIWPGY